MKRCQKCGQEYEDSARFCSRDGGNLEEIRDDLAETILKSANDKDESKPKGLLGKLLRHKTFKLLADEARDLTKATLSIVVEQTVRNRGSDLPEIPLAAVGAAVWVGKSAGDAVMFPVKLKKGKVIEIKAHRTPPGPWRVVEVRNLKVLLPLVQGKTARDDEEQL